MFLPLQMFTYTVIDAEAMSADITSERVNVSRTGSVSVQWVWSGGSSPVGNMITQVSNDGSTWVDLNTQAVTGNSGSHMINIEEPAYMFIRALYSFSSGSGTLSCIINGKKL